MRSEERGLFEISYLAAGIFCNAECHLSAFPSPVFQQGRDEGLPVHWRTVQATEAATGYQTESRSPDGCTPSQPASFWLVPCKRVLLLVSSLSGLPGWMLLLSEGVCLLGPARLKELRQASPPTRDPALSSQHSYTMGTQRACFL